MNGYAIASPFVPIAVKRRFNTWYSLADGNWNDPTIWISNSRRKYSYPQPGDNVYINHNVTANFSTTCNNLRISGYLTFSNNIVITVNGDIQVVGTVDMTATGSQLMLNNVNSKIKNLIGGSGSVTYTSAFDCQISANTYNGLTIQGGTKILSGDTIISALTGQTLMDLALYNLTVLGATSFSSIPVSTWGISKTSSGGTILFVGFVTFFHSNMSIDSASIEFRGGLSFNVGTISIAGCSINFTTNNQSITTAGITVSLGNVLISNVIVTNESSTGNFTINGQLNGSTSTSKWINKGSVYFNTTLLPMPTGIFDYLTFSTSEVGYIMNGDYKLPYTSYQCLYIAGTGTKILGGVTTIGNKLTVASGGTLDLQSYDLTVPGTSIISGLLKRTGTGATIFVGLVTIVGSFSFGSNLLEFRGGLVGGGSTLTLNADINFTTNNQNIDATTANIPASLTLNGSIIISGAITITAGNHLPTFSAIMIQQLNGDNAASTFVNKASGTGSAKGLHYTGTTQPMATGILDCSSFANTFNYDLAGDQEVKGTTYSTLILGGSGVKKLMGNVTVPAANYSVTGTASVNLNGHTLTLT